MQEFWWRPDEVLVIDLLSGREERYHKRGEWFKATMVDGAVDLQHPSRDIPNLHLSLENNLIMTKGLSDGVDDDFLDYVEKGRISIFSQPIGKRYDCDGGAMYYRFTKVGRSGLVWVPYRDEWWYAFSTNNCRVEVNR